jgi:hypothetical protein
MSGNAYTITAEDSIASKKMTVSRLVDKILQGPKNHANVYKSPYVLKQTNFKRISCL